MNSPYSVMIRICYSTTTMQRRSITCHPQHHIASHNISLYDITAPYIPPSKPSQDIATCEASLAEAITQEASCSSSRLTVDALKAKKAVIEGEAAAALAAKDFDTVKCTALFSFGTLHCLSSTSAI